MKAKVKYITLVFLALAVLGISCAAFAVESTKPSSHDISWLHRHGPASKATMSECLECHTDKISCIQCHKDVAPRNHTAGWIKKGHGLEARWERTACLSCHKQDMCTECHQSMTPVSHRGNWASSSGHCLQCHKGALQETTCYVCHKTTHHKW
jgi:hypothetical protein